MCFHDFEESAEGRGSEQGIIVYFRSASTKESLEVSGRGLVLARRRSRFLLH